MNGSGSRKPNIARLGIVCTTLATPISGAASRGRRAAKMPSGTPIATAISVETRDEQHVLAEQPRRARARCDEPEREAASSRARPRGTRPDTASSSGRTRGSAIAAIAGGAIAGDELAVVEHADAVAERERFAPCRA